MKPMSENEFEWAWFAGFFDGEGCLGASCNDKRKAKNGFIKHEVNIRLDVSQVDRAPLDKIQVMTGCGTVSPKPLSKKFKARQSFAWRLSGATKIRKILLKILPYAIVKRPQIITTLELLDTFRSAGGHCNIPTDTIQHRRKLVAKIKKLKQTRICDLN
jgi:hypothetical protein